MDDLALQRCRRRRLGILLLLVFAAGAKLGWSLFDIQVLRHERFRGPRAEPAGAPDRTSPRGAGTSTTANGVPLAVNRERYSLYMVPNHVRDPRAFLDAFTALVPPPRRALRERLARGGYYVRCPQRDRHRPPHREGAIPGLGVETQHERYYPHGRWAAGVLGQVDVDNSGIGGLELQTMRCSAARRWAVTIGDARGREYANLAFPAVQPENGEDLYLTLDVGLQEIAERRWMPRWSIRARAAARWCGAIRARRDPRDGQPPRADPNAERVSVKNYAAVDVFEPGSTFKLVTLAGLYEERMAEPEERIFCENGSYRFARRSKPIRDVHAFGMLTVEEVIGKSSNICTIKLARRLGDERMFEYARRFGFGVPSGVDFPGESRGVLRLPREWSALLRVFDRHGLRSVRHRSPATMMFAAMRQRRELLQPYLVRRARAPGWGSPAAQRAATRAPRRFSAARRRR